MTSSNPTFKPSDGKREEFRKYLEKNGVMDALTKVLVSLYEETNKPEDAREYLRDRLAVIAGIETYKEMKEKLLHAEKIIKSLEEKLGTTSGDKKIVTSGVDITESNPEEEETSEKTTGEPQTVGTEEKTTTETAENVPDPESTDQ